MTPDQVRAVIFSFPGVEEGFSLGSVIFKANGKTLARLGVRTGPGDLQINGINAADAETLIDRDPKLFHTTPHFEAAKCLLARIGPLKADVLRPLIEHRWRQIAPKAEVAAWDAARSGSV